MPQMPKTTVELFNVPWDSGYRNLRYFASTTERDRWFDSQTKRVSIERDGQPVIVGRPYTVPNTWDTLHNYNYMRFKNNAYVTGEYVYCFIDRIEQKSQRSSNLYFTVDNYQTYLGELKFGECHIKYEHTVDDTVTYLPEPVTVNRMINKYYHDFLPTDGGFCYILIASQSAEGSTAHVMQNDGFPTGLTYFFCRSLKTLNAQLDNYNATGRADSILNIVAIPNALVDGEEGWGGVTFARRTVNVAKPTKIDGYTPKNAKCWTYPFCYLTVIDNQGSVREYKYEDASGSWKFIVDGRVDNNVTIELKPDFDNNNLGYLDNICYDATAAVSYASNFYKGWQSRNMQQQAAKVASSIATTSISLAGMAVAPEIAVPALAGNAIGLANSMQSVHQSELQAKYTPNPANVSSNMHQYLAANGRINFSAFLTCCDKSTIKAIDDRFTRCGYRVDRLDRPNPNNRSDHYYCECEGAVVTGRAPQSARNDIANALNRGVTFWHHDNIGVY